MLLLIDKSISEENLKKAAEEFDGYIKVVVDIEKEILTAGGKRHFDGEQMLLQNGSKQSSLWGGGLDLETGEIDYDSMINLRPIQNNNSREVLDEETRSAMTEIIIKLLK
ncbi:MAG: DUF5674 family protein [bacterium]|nr:DUF5674 family protein [bacterium]